MSGPKEEVEYARVMSLEEAIEHVGQILEALKTSHVRVEGGGTALELNVPSQVRLKVEGERKPKKEEISIKLQWFRGAEGPRGGAAGVQPAGT
jgi:amphi-Trp domain-containing protein